jgi:hypothetical protein
MQVEDVVNVHDTTGEEDDFDHKCEHFTYMNKKTLLIPYSAVPDDFTFYYKRDADIKDETSGGSRVVTLIECVNDRTKFKTIVEVRQAHEWIAARTIQRQWRKKFTDEKSKQKRASRSAQRSLVSTQTLEVPHLRPRSELPVHF